MRFFVARVLPPSSVGARYKGNVRKSSCVSCMCVCTEAKSYADVRVCSVCLNVCRAAHSQVGMQRSIVPVFSIS